MEVILLDTVEKLGKMGEVVKVKDGYARNFLIPKKLAILNNRAAFKVLETKRKKEALRLEKQKKGALETAKKLAGLSLTVSMEAGADDIIFGAVTTDAIAIALRNEGIEIDKRTVTFLGPIKKLGVYTVEVKLHSEVKESLRVWVVKK